MRFLTYISCLLPIIAVCAHPLPDKLSASLSNLQVARDLAGCDSPECTAIPDAQLIQTDVANVAEVADAADVADVDNVEDVDLEAAKGGKVPPPRTAKTPSKPPKVKSDIPVAPRPPKPSNKITADEQKARKDAVKSKMDNHQRFNDKGKKELSPEDAKKKEEKITEKSKESQKKADERGQQRKQEGKEKVADAVAAYKGTKNLPNRDKVFNVNEHVDGKVQTVQYTGADARTAVFNSHLHKDDKVNFQPKTFENRPQGPAGNKSKPIPTMKGKAAEFPISQEHGGYKGGKPGAARVIVQPTDSESGHKFVGVVAHDASLPQGHPGHNDHFQVKSTKKSNK